MTWRPYGIDRSWSLLSGRPCSFVRRFPKRTFGADRLAAVQSVANKTGALKVELHGKLTAMNSLAKILGMALDAEPAPTQKNPTINAGEANSLEMVRRLGFLFESARFAAPQIEGEPGKSAEPSKQTVEGRPKRVRKRPNRDGMASGRPRTGRDGAARQRVK